MTIRKLMLATVAASLLLAVNPAMARPTLGQPITLTENTKGLQRLESLDSHPRFSQQERIRPRYDLIFREHRRRQHRNLSSDSSWH
jgi:hypothetical protein